MIPLILMTSCAINSEHAGPRACRGRSGTGDLVTSTGGFGAGDYSTNDGGASISAKAVFYRL